MPELLAEHGITMKRENVSEDVGIEHYDAHTAYLVSLWAYYDFRWWDYSPKLGDHFK